MVALHLAAEYNHVDIIDYLIEEKNIFVDTPTKRTNYYCGKDNSPIFECATHSCVEAAERLIYHKANVNFINLDGATPLDGADTSNVLKSKTLLLENETPLNYLSEDERIKTQRLIDPLLQVKTKLPSTQAKVSDLSIFAKAEIKSGECSVVPEVIQINSIFTSGC